MKHLFLTAAIAAAALNTGHGQARPAAKAPAAKPTAAAAPAAEPAPAAPTDEEAPKYAGFYIGGKQVSEISCYGVDEMNIVYPFFGSLETCDHFTVNTIGGSYDTKGKLQIEYIDRANYDRADMENLRAKYANKGYGVINRSNLLEGFNKHREVRPNSAYVVDEEHPAFSVLKYTELDPAKVANSVLFFEVITYNFNGQYVTGGYANAGDPLYAGRVVYTSPKIPLKGRVTTASVGAKSSTAKKGLAFVPIVGIVASAVKEKPLPEMTNENCVSVGQPVTLTTVKKVLRDNIGEEITVD
jgi:hypothetical protein